MKFLDFEYDGQKLSDFGYMLCSFNNVGEQTVSLGSEINFNNVSVRHGEKQELASINYDDVITATFQICKKVCDTNYEFEISDSEERALSRWLNRKEFLKFKPLRSDEDMYDYYFEASFNLSKITIGNVIYGLELNMTTNRPFGLHETISETITVSDDKTFVIEDISDEIGFSYPKVDITIKEAGDLTIVNTLENRTMQIKNCSVGEMISMDYPMISTSLDSHKIQDDFNWEFFRIANTFENNRNTYTTSLLCEINYEYSPIAKIGV